VVRLNVSFGGDTSRKKADKTTLNLSRNEKTIYQAIKNSFEIFISLNPFHYFYQKIKLRIRCNLTHI